MLAGGVGNAAAIALFAATLVVALRTASGTKSGGR
jgi:hypothetical protein